MSFLRLSIRTRWESPTCSNHNESALASLPFSHVSWVLWILFTASEVWSSVFRGVWSSVWFGFLESLEVQCSVLEHACRLGMNLKVPNLKLSRTLGLGFKTDCWTNELLKKSNWISNFRFILHSGPENLKKYRPKKLVKWNKSISLKKNSDQN